MDDWKLGISADGRSLVKRDGSPFFWLADTAWDLFFRLDRDDAALYFQNRHDKGFTIIQAVVVMGYHVPFNTTNVYGHRPFVDTESLQPDLHSEQNYWTHVDALIDMAAEHGLYIALLPVWGDFVCGRKPVFNRESLCAYMAWIADRYKDRPNIIWVNGGDTDLAFHDFADVPTWKAAGKTLRKHDPGHLITYHPRGGSSSSAHYHNETWMDLNTFQSGHSRRYGGGDAMAAHDWTLSPVKPTLDSESCYEQHPVNWNFENGYIDDHDTRRALYGSLMAGACGHTYGHVNMWIFYDPEEGKPELRKVELPHNLHWKRELDCPGAWQLHYAKQLFLSRPFLTRKPAQSLLLDSSHGRRVLIGEGFLFAYSPLGHEIAIDMTHLPWSKHVCWWFDPRTGASHRIAMDIEVGKATFTPPGTPYRGNDWVLVIDDASKGFAVPGAGNDLV